MIQISVILLKLFEKTQIKEKEEQRVFQFVLKGGYVIKMDLVIIRKN